ncbi:MAG: hypothetical protein WEC79_03965 [Thermomicrobiales bacterium]
MGISRVINRRTAVLGLLLMILAAAGFGFAASNTVEVSGAGDGAATITGYDITNVDYSLDPGSPTVIDEIQFDVAAQAGGPTTRPDSVVALLTTGGNDWYDCTSADVTSPFTFVCTGGSTTAAAADQLRVVAAN